MSWSAKIRQIREKKRAALVTAERHEEIAAAFRREAEECDIAERVLLSIEEPDDEMQKYGPPSLEEPSTSAGQRGILKPEHLPTMPQMIEEALALAQNSGSPGLEPAAIQGFIKGRYWPEAPLNSVGPIAWRMWKRGQLLKSGALYALPPGRTKGTPGGLFLQRSKVEAFN